MLLNQNNKRYLIFRYRKKKDKYHCEVRTAVWLTGLSAKIGEVICDEIDMQNLRSGMTIELEDKDNEDATQDSQRL